MSVAVTTQGLGAGVASLPLDEYGFLIERKSWNRAIAQQLADRNGLGQLGTTQWMIIDYIRDKYFRLGALPPMRNMCRKLGVNRDAVKKAFGNCRQLWQIAGLPNPGEEALTYME
ncbi:TusE/DsrC/DsvC family sulfur relay protein [Thiosocius teredinicola]|uniref:TusE/DsrC/DsvC family sulfur relay protein n=1 Tax=Thiosocius teredinicola TaxID=1973002 RepID=UPI000991053C